MPQECGDKILAVLRGFLSRANLNPFERSSTPEAASYL
jgi:hypothetical protein